MGSSQSKSADILKYFQTEWQYLSTTKQNIKIYRNRHTDQQAELHTVNIDPRASLQKQYDIYNYRRSQDNALVSVYAVQNMKDTSPNLCGNREILKVMVESMPHRLGDLSKLPFRDSLYVLSEAIRGFDDCHSKIGEFDINERMLGLNSNGSLKVWLSENFAENHPDQEKPILQTTTVQSLRQRANKQEGQMLKKVVQLVEQKCAEKFPSDLTAALGGQTNFVDAYQSIEKYCQGHQIELPDRIVLETMREGEKLGEKGREEKEGRQGVAEKHNLLPVSSITPVLGNQSNFSFKNQSRDTLVGNIDGIGLGNRSGFGQSLPLVNFNHSNRQSLYPQPAPITFNHSVRASGLMQSPRMTGLQGNNQLRYYQSPQKLLRQTAVHPSVSPGYNPNVNQFGLNFSYQNNKPNNYSSYQPPGYTSGSPTGYRLA